MDCEMPVFFRDLFLVWQTFLQIARIFILHLAIGLAYTGSCKPFHTNFWQKLRDLCLSVDFVFIKKPHHPNSKSIPYFGNLPEIMFITILLYKMSCDDGKGRKELSVIILQFHMKKETSFNCKRINMD